MVTAFHTLPQDIIYQILQHLSLTERFRLASTCKAWKRIHLDGMVSADIRTFTGPDDIEAVVKSLESLICGSKTTLCSLTVHLHCECLRGGGDGCTCPLPSIGLLPCKRLLPFGFSTTAPGMHMS